MRDTTRLLTRHFFRRFIENDLISPDADRHHTLTVLCACVLSFGLLVTMLLAIKYLGGLPTPGQVSLLSLDDKFLYIGWSMAMMALVTLAEWDALGLDIRDASILGPLPLDATTIFKAKAAALLLFAGGCVIVLNVVPTILFSSAMVAMLVVGPAAYAAQIATHAAITAAAGAFSFFSVLALREILHAVLGTSIFRRVSMVLQASLVVFFVTSLCLLPGLSDRIGRERLSPDHMTYALPPLWFLGLYETWAGHVMDDLPRAHIPRRLVAIDRRATGIYRARRPVFGRLAAIAMTALPLAAILAAAAYTWNNRRLPPPLTPQQNEPHRIRRLLVRSAERSVVRHPLTRAGFFFTIQTLWRSSTHRLTMAVSVALSLAFTIVTVHGTGMASDLDPAKVPLWVFAVEAMVIIVLLAGFRYAARLPAELSANWAFQLSWSGEPARYLAGVKRAALVCVLAPALVILFPLHAAIMGARLAALHLACGLFIGIAGVEIAMLGCRTLPFASSYAASDNLKGWLALCVVGFWPLTRVMAGLERAALGGWSTTVGFMAALILLSAGVRLLESRQRQGYGAVEFYELPAHAERLNLGA